MKIIKLVKPYVEGVRSMDEYEFVGHADFDRSAFERAYPHDGANELDNRIDQAVDSLYDGDHDIYDTDLGLCMVSLHWSTKEPLCWCLVKRREK